MDPESAVEPWFETCLTVAQTCTISHKTEGKTWWIHVIFAGIIDNTVEVQTQVKCEGSTHLSVRHHGGIPAGINPNNLHNLDEGIRVKVGQVPVPFVALAVKAVSILEGGILPTGHDNVDNVEACSYVPQLTTCTTKHDVPSSFQIETTGELVANTGCVSLTVQHSDGLIQALDTIHETSLCQDLGGVTEDPTPEAPESGIF